MILYMAVTADKYELPLAVAESPQELADMMQTGTSNILTAISRGLNGKCGGIKYLMVREELEYNGLVYIPDTRNKGAVKK